MKLIVGLGNPTKKYENTRHNVGFMYIDMLAQKYNIMFKEKFNGLLGEIHVNGEKILLLKPTTYMNDSGISVKQVIKFYNISTNDILIIYDDLDMEFSKIKLKVDSSSGGHNGIKSIVSHLNTQKLLRIKYGILNDRKKNVKDFVLSMFSKEEVKKIQLDFEIINNIICEFINLKSSEYNTLLNKYNKKK